MRRFTNSKLLFNIKSFDAVPGPKPYPILGNANLFFSKPYYKVHEDLKADYGNLVKFKMFSEESVLKILLKTKVLVSDPEEIQKVFMSNQVGPERTNMEAWIQYRIDNNLSLGVTQVNGEEWKRLRSGFLKLLSPQVVDSYVSRVADIAQGFNQWVEENRENGMVDYTKPTQFYGLEAIMSIVLGKKLRLFEISYDQIDHSVLKFVDGIRRWLDETDTYMFKDLPWHYLKIKSNCVKRMHKAMDDVFEIAPEMIENKNIGVSYNDGKKNYIEYVEENENLTENEKTVSLVEMLGAGVDTVMDLFFI
jgi:cytochrome P450